MSLLPGEARSDKGVVARHRAARLALCGLAVAVLSVTASALEAAPLVLDGTWQVLHGETPEYPPAEVGWQEATVPGCLYGAGVGGAWLRRNVELSPANAERFILRLWGVYFEPRVWVNGQQVWDGSMPVTLPFDLDVTSAVVEGQNEVLIWVRDWSGTHHTKIPFTGLAVNEDPRSRTADKIVEPLPPDFLCFGLLDSVVVRPVARVRVDDILVESTLSMGDTGTAKIQPALFNSGTEPEQVRIDGLVLDAADNPVASFGQDAVWLYPGTQRIVLPVSTGVNHPWTPADPYLYKVRVELKQSGQTRHAMEARFGFRQVTTNSKLNLNGLAVVGSMEELWPSPEYYQADAAYHEMQLLKERGITVVTLRGGRWPQAWYQAADELGLLVFASSNLDCDRFGSYKYTLDEFFEAAARDVENVLRLVAVHPGVAGVAVERGLLACGEAFPPVLERRRELVSVLMQRARAMEDSRPLFTPGDLEGTGDPDLEWVELGISLADRPSVQRWLTLTTEGLTLPSLSVPWKWAQEKPLVISGIGIPDGDPTQASALLGPDGKYAQSRCVAMAGEYFKRVREVLWLKGATLVAPEVNRSDRLTFHLPGRIPDWGTGRDIEWVYRTVGDHFRAGQSRPLRWDVVATGVRRLTGAVLRIRGPLGDVLVERGINFAPGESSTLDVMVKAPVVPSGQPWADFAVLLEVEYQGETVTRTQMFRAYPESTITRLPDWVTVVDPLGTLPDAIAPASGGVAAEGLTDLLTASRLTVVAPGAFAGLAGTPAPHRVFQDGEQLLMYYVESGGTLVVFKQSSYAGLLPFALTDSAPRILRGLPGHPISDGLLDFDLNGWKTADGLVGDSVIQPPLWGSFRCLISAPAAGAPQGCLVAEVPRGQGRMLLVQMALGDMAEQEPAAALLLARLADYALLLSQTPAYAPRVSTPDEELAAVLGSLCVPLLPEEMRRECSEVLVQSVTQTLTDSVLSEIAKEYPVLKLAWFVLESLDLATSLSPWKSAGLVSLPAPALPLIPVEQERRALADVFFESMVPGPAPSGALPGFASPALNPEIFGAADIQAPSVCLGPGQLAWVVGTWEPGVALSVKVTADVSSPLDRPVVLSVSGQQTQIVALPLGDDSTGVAVLPLGVGEEGTLWFRNEAQVMDVLSGQGARVCISEIEAGEMPGVPDARLDTSPALWLGTSFWGYPTVFDGSGRWQIEGGATSGLAAISRFLADQQVPVDTPVGITLDATDFQVVESQLHGVENDGLLWLRDNGSLTMTLDFPVTGPYRILVAGRGRPANAIWPAPEVRVDGKLAGLFSFADQLATYYVDAEVEKGEHTLSVSFVNDAYLPPEDRDAGFDTISVVALRANYAPLAGIHTRSLPEGLELAATCAWDPDGDEMTYTWSWTIEGCFAEPMGTSQELQPLLDLDYGSYWVSLTVKDSRGAFSTRCVEVFHDGSQVVEVVEVVEPVEDVVEETIETDSSQPQPDFQVGDAIEDTTGTPPKKKSDGCAASSGLCASPHWMALAFLLWGLLAFLKRRG